MRAEIIAIGDELLIGQVVNTNAAFIAQQLNAVGIAILRTTTVGDDEDEILKAFQGSIENADITIVTGGLGPTHDDITKKTICGFFETDLTMNQEVLLNIRELLQRRNVLPTKMVEEQALVPRIASVIRNELGTAPGLFIEQNHRYFFALPGVPHEMERMVDNFIVPLLRSKRSGLAILHRTLSTTGIPESALAEKLGDLAALLGNAKLAFLPSTSGVRLRITVVDKHERAAAELIDEVESRIRTKVGKYIYGVDDETLEQCIGAILVARHLRLAVAESCTGGLIAHRLTNVSGSSRYFDRAVIAYSNQAKVDNLNVPPESIEAHGAVSKEVAEAMASGIRQVARTDIGISTTGIAGPTGGTPEKPVGLAWIGYSDRQETMAIKCQFGYGRLQIKERTAQAALDLIRRKLLQLV
ncbi:MAG: competence/damage-inducible protein A [Bacteroidota bacterium]|jgi:nicotinamide-nucleotide amidase